ncbi:hypothetical protein LCGC14_1386200 [marine sediment metagenome]|uniref:Histidine kinase N-terminal 7TM region domain-containing protein n=1 Tax=marine sediment metagenome TaxID=412755 RepID=A0A0F9KM63_9ZZZZ|nr:MAG: hypothetical protein Lokiarch_01660 [Candidatus Lokiarchaeum sp. GC14_75]
MSYTPFLPRVLPIFIYYICLSLFGVFVTIKMFLKWRERKVRPPLYLALVFLFLALTLFTLLVGLAEAIIVGEFREIYRLSLPIGYFMVILADIFLFIFASHMTDKGKKAIALVIVIGLSIAVIVFLPWNWWGVPQVDYEGLLNIRLYTTLGIMLYSNLIYLYIAYISNKVKKNVEDKVMYTGLKLLFYSMIGLILLFVMLTGDTILITFGHEGYSEFIYLAWGFGLIFIVLSYLSLIMPNWLIKRIKKKYSE